MPNPLPAIYYKGRHNRSSLEEDTPSDHGYDEKNIQFFEKGCGSRGGFNMHLEASGAWNGVALRVHVYERVGEASRLIILDDLNQLWDSTSFAAPIHTFAGVTVDFAMRSLYNRAYISPHNRVVGNTGEFVYVYDGSTFRKAAGVAPTGYTLVAAQGAAGHVEKGNHLFSVCYEFESGYISAPAFSGTTVVNHESLDATHKIDLSAIPAGDAGLGHVGRYIVCTPVLGVTYNGNPAEQEWYFVPNGHIADNTTATLTLDFYDADLLSSADYLQYQLPSIPAGVALADYNGRLIVLGDPAKVNNPWVSAKGNAESISSIDGWITVDPGDSGGGCKNAVSHRGLLYITKSQRTYNTQDNGAAPSTWNIDKADASVGAECYSIGVILNNPGSTQDTIFIGDRTGLYMYPSQSGNSDPLTWKIEELWTSIRQEYFQTVQVFVDMVAQVIYVNVPLTDTTPDTILIGDFKLGLNKDSIRWSLWEIPKSPSTIWLDIDSSYKPILRFGSYEGTIYKYDPTAHTDFDATVAIDSIIQFGPNPEDSGGYVNQLDELRFRVIGSGTLNLAVQGLDAAIVTTLPSITLSSSPGREYARQCSIANEKMMISLQTYNGTDWFTFYCMRISISPLWFSRPQI